jgi:acetyl esterase/lipase
VQEYTLYPDASADEQATEVSTAFEWVREYADQCGASVDDITVVGHSAGASRSPLPSG